MNEQPIIDEGSMMVDLASSDTKDNSIMMLVSGDGRCCMCYNMTTLERLNLTEEQKILLANMAISEEAITSVVNAFSNDEPSLSSMNELEKELLLHDRSNNKKDKKEKNWRKKNFYD